MVIETAASRSAIKVAAGVFVCTAAAFIISSAPAAARAEPAFTIFYDEAATVYWGRAVGDVIALWHSGKVQGKDFALKDLPEAPPHGPGDPPWAVINGEFVADGSCAHCGRCCLPTPSPPAPPATRVRDDRTSTCACAAVLKKLGDALGLCGKTADLVALCRPRLEELNELALDAGFDRLKDTKAAEWFAKLEGWLEDSAWFLGDEPSIVDFHGVFAFSWIEKNFIGTHGGSFAAYPKVAKWWVAVNELPAVAMIHASPVAVLPSFKPVGYGDTPS